MSDKTKTALAEISIAVGGDLEKFAPSDRKSFLGEAALTAFALLLLHSFLAGLKQAAEEKAKELGQTVFRVLWEAITDLFSGNKSGKAKETLAKESADAVAVVAALPAEKLNAALNTVESELKQVLVKNLSAKRADRLAKSVRASVEKHLLAQRAPS